MLGFFKDLLVRSNTSSAPLPTQIVPSTVPVIESSFKFLGRVVDSKIFQETVLTKTILPLVWTFTGGVLASATVAIAGPLVERLGRDLGKRLMESNWVRRTFKIGTPTAMATTTEPVQQTLSEVTWAKINPFSDQSLLKSAIVTLKDKVATPPVVTPPVVTPPVVTPPVVTPPVADTLSAAAEAAAKSSEIRDWWSVLFTFENFLITSSFVVGGGIFIYYLYSTHYQQIGLQPDGYIFDRDLRMHSIDEPILKSTAPLSDEVIQKIQEEVMKSLANHPSLVDNVQKVVETTNDKIT